MLVVGKRLLPWLLRQVAKTGSRELFTLSVLVFAIGIAYSTDLPCQFRIGCLLLRHGDA